jgi:signal transduction histidine kinase
MIGITSLRQAIERGGERAASAVEFVAVAVRDAQQTCERILQGLSPLDATAGDLLAALRNLPRQFPPESQAHLNVEIKDAAAVSLSLPMREHLYQLAREGVNNALKHAKAERITIRLEVTPALITLIVSDDGVGFDPKTRRSKGLGLQSIALRATAVRGRLAITRRPSGGMAIVCRCAQTAA